MISAYRSVTARQQVGEWCEKRLRAWEVPHEAGWVGQTHLVVAGPERGLPVVLVPGTNFNAATSLHLAALLARRWPTYVADPPGQPGLSSPGRPRQRRLEWYGRWLADVLRDGVGRPSVVVGHSLGAGISLACTSRLIAGRVLVSPAGLARLRTPPAVTRAAMAWMLRPGDAPSARLLERLMAPGGQPPRELVEWMTLVSRSCYSSLTPPALPPQVLARCRDLPIVVATGEHDPVLPPWRLDEPADEHLGAAVRVLPGTGHLVPEEHPDAILPLVAEAVDGSRLD